MKRYQMLERRLQTSAICAHTLPGFWTRMTSSLQLPLHSEKQDTTLLRFFTLPAVVQQQILVALIGNTRALVSIARVWHDANASQNVSYAAKKDKTAGMTFEEYAAAFEPREERNMSFTVNDLAPAQNAVILDVPYLSPNGLRHMLREAAWQHLTAILDIPALWPGDGPYPQSVEALFRNGGNLRGSEPMGASALAAKIRRTFPSLDLLGGCVDTFNLDESRLAVAAWLLCTENATTELPAWAQARPALGMSAFEMLDDMTQTRQSINGLHQMIYNFEPLVQGTEFYLRLRLHPFTHPLTQGALLAAVETWATVNNRVAGKAAEGFSTVLVQEMARNGLVGSVAEYEDYLTENADHLRAELAAGTLGSGSKTALLS